jgi:hypothetical protein
MSHQFRRHPEEMNNQRIQKSENEKTHLKYPMSNNENFTKSGSNLTEDGFDNVKDSDNICNEYVNLKFIFRILHVFLLQAFRNPYNIKSVVII